MSIVPNYTLETQSGTFISAGPMQVSTPFEVNAAPDSYRLTMTYNGVLNGTLTNGTTMMEFNTALSDSNPPVLQEIQVLDTGNRREKVLDGHGQIAIRAEDATAGMTLQIDIDHGAGWQALPVTYSAGFYRASVPAFAPTDSTSVSLRISAQDLVGNRLVNTIAPAFIVMPDCQPPTVPAVTASQSGNKVQLSWLPTGASQYFVWTSINTPYLTPGANCTAPNCISVASSPWLSNAVLGDPATNPFYVVQAQSACGQSAPEPSNRTGGFTFALTPGAPCAALGWSPSPPARSRWAATRRTTTALAVPAMSPPPVTLSAYCIDKTEVTNAQYAQCVAAGVHCAAEQFVLQPVRPIMLTRSMMPTR